MRGVPGKNVILPSVQPCNNNPILSVCLPGRPENLWDVHVSGQSPSFQKNMRFSKYLGRRQYASPAGARSGQSPYGILFLFQIPIPIPTSMY